MAGQPVPFPNIRPSRRTFTHGEYPTNIFRAQNGASVAVRFGTRPYECKLRLQFKNITDEQANDILKNYEDVNGSWDYVNFVNDKKTMEAGVSNEAMKKRLRGRTQALKCATATPVRRRLISHLWIAATSAANLLFTWTAE